MQPEHHEIGGTGLAHCDARYLAALKYFGQVGQLSSATSFPVIATQRNKQWDVGSDAPQRLWRLDSTVREMQRVATQPPLTPATQEQIERSGTDRTLLKLAISMTQMGFDPRVYTIDAGSSLEFWAHSVNVKWIAPVGVNAVADMGPEPNVNVADAMVIDGLLGVQVLAIETPIGVTAPLTVYRPVAAAAVLTLPIPRGARDVTIYQTAAGAASVEWTWSYGDPASIAPVWALGQIPFITGTRRTPTISVVPGATHIVSDIDLLTSRFFTVVWTIQP